jgi:hypothetical protein
MGELAGLIPRLSHAIIKYYQYTTGKKVGKKAMFVIVIFANKLGFGHKFFIFGSNFEIEVATRS